MTSNINIPMISKVNNMAEGIKGFVGRKMTKNAKFMGEDVKISKLSVSEVMEVQEKAKNLEGNESEGFNVLKIVIRAGVEGGKDLADQDFENFPLDELSKLSTEIMKFSGIGQDSGK
jgi:hypothetical protein